MIIALTAPLIAGKPRGITRKEQWQLYSQGHWATLGVQTRLHRTEAGIELIHTIKAGATILKLDEA